jgi:hypothetical protein
VPLGSAPIGTISGPYTYLPLQVAGFFAAGAILAMLIGRKAGWTSVPLAVTVMLTVVAVPALWGGLGTMDRVRASLTVSPGIAERETCFVEAGRPDALAMARWLAQRIPGSATFAYDAGQFDTPCMQYALLPRRMVARSQSPQFLVYTKPRDPAARALLRSQQHLPPGQRRLEFLNPDTALERVR